MAEAHTSRSCRTAPLVANVVKAGNGGGAYGAILNNCALTGNSARAYVRTTATLGGRGGGVCGGSLSNCTLTGNFCDVEAGGAYLAGLRNRIVCFNEAPSGANWESATFAYSCTTPLPPGEGNIAADPVLASATHLSLASPCLGAGNRAYAGGTDIDGEPWRTHPPMAQIKFWPGQSVGR